MKPVDRLLQKQRVSKVRPYIKPGARVLDIGCADGALFSLLGPLIGEGVGIDPALSRSVERDNYRLIAGSFPEDLRDQQTFDVITLLAVLEHVPPDRQAQLASNCALLLKHGGYLLATVPSAFVDAILSLLKLVRLIDGMSLEEHYGFDANKTPAVFSDAGFTLHRNEKFQFGLNNFFVFVKN